MASSSWPLLWLGIDLAWPIVIGSPPLPPTLTLRTSCLASTGTLPDRGAIAIAEARLVCDSPEMTPSIVSSVLLLSHLSQAILSYSTYHDFKNRLVSPRCRCGRHFHRCMRLLAQWDRLSSQSPFHTTRSIHRRQEQHRQGPIRDSSRRERLYWQVWCAPPWINCCDKRSLRGQRGAGGTDRHPRPQGCSRGTTVTDPRRTRCVD